MSSFLVFVRHEHELLLGGDEESGRLPLGVVGKIIIVNED